MRALTLDEHNKDRGFPTINRDANVLCPRCLAMMKFADQFDTTKNEPTQRAVFCRCGLTGYKIY